MQNQEPIFVEDEERLTQERYKNMEIQQFFNDENKLITNQPIQ